MDAKKKKKNSSKYEIEKTVHRSNLEDQESERTKVKAPSKEEAKELFDYLNDEDNGDE